MFRINSTVKILALVSALAVLLSFTVIATGAGYEQSVDVGTSLLFSDDGIEISNDNGGVKIDKTALTINKEGTYIVSGTCSDGSIKIKKGTTGVILVLNGLTLTSNGTAAIACNKSSEVNIIVADGTVNNLSDSKLNNDENYPDNSDAENAVIKCKDGSEVIINGSGTLNINALGKNGIKSGATTENEGEASLTIREVTLNITASVNDAINAEQELNIESGNLTISAADDAVHCDLNMNIGDDNTDGPTIKITDCYEGLEAATLNIYSGNIDITASDDCLNAANSDLTDYDFEMNISGGTITAYSSTGDGFDSNGNLTISGGNITIQTANQADNQPLDADGTITVSGGTIFAAGGSAGMNMNLNALQPYVVYGGNKNGGQNPPQNDNENKDFDRQPPQDGQMTPPNDSERENQDNAPPIQNGENTGNQPPEAPQFPSNSENLFNITKGATVAVNDSSGKTVFSTTAACDISYVFYSSPDLTSGNSYNLLSAGTQLGEAVATTGSSSGSEVPTPPESKDEDNKNNSGNSDFGGETSTSDTSSTNETVDGNDNSTAIESTTSSKQTTNDSLPTTSDTARILQSVIILSISAAVLFLLVFFRKKDKE